jgi:hypothetical protein
MLRTLSRKAGKRFTGFFNSAGTIFALKWQSYPRVLTQKLRGAFQEFFDRGTYFFDFFGVVVHEV